MRDFNHTEIDNLDAAETRPIFLVEWAYGSPQEFLSCSGAVTYAGQAYTAGGCNISSIQDSKTAVLTLPATSARVIDLQTNIWRGGICKITYIPGLPGDSGTYTAAQGHLIVDGVIESMQLSGEVITVNVKSKYYIGSLVPKFQLDEIANHLPPVGTLVTWEGETLTYEQWIRTTRRVNELARSGAAVVSRISTSEANEFTRPETGYVPLSGEGVHLPLVYGRTSVPGYIFAQVEIESPNLLIVGVAWCLGEIYNIEETFINDAVLPTSGVAVRHYRGTPTQSTDPWLGLFISGYVDDMVYHLDAGDLGVCYSVYRIEVGALTGAPRFRAIIQGQLVVDPSGDGTADPFYDSVGVQVDFTVGTTDTGPNAHTLTLNGSPVPALASPSVGLPLNGSGQYVSIADDTTMEISGQDFTVEIEGSATSVTASPEDTETLFSHGSTTSPLSYSIKVNRIGNKLYTYLSSDGSTWDILDAEATGTITTDTFRLVIERIGQDYMAFLDGVERWHVTNTSNIFDSGADWYIGAGEADWTGIIKSFRLTVGVFRYGSPHAITNTPYSDSGNYTANAIYSTKPALAWNDLASNAIYGLGATTTGVEEVVAYGEEILLVEESSPTITVERCNIGLALTEVKRAEEWLTMLATYANALWFPEGENLRLRADKSVGADNASGRDIVINGEMSAEGSPEDWVKGTGWTIGSPEGVASSDGTQVSASSLTQTLTTVDGDVYAISVRIATASTESPQGGITVEFNSTEVITTKTAAGTYTAQVTASGTSNDLEIIADTGFNGAITDVKCQRQFALVTNWIKSSLNMTGLSESDTPNKVVVQYSEPSSTVGAWNRQSVSAESADVEAGAVIIQTTLDLPGVYSYEEASNKALTKLARVDNRYTVSFVETDSGVMHQPGDAVEIVGSYRGIDARVWVESVEMIDYGRYRVNGSVYRDEITEAATPGIYDGGNDGGGSDQFPDRGFIGCYVVFPTGEDINAELIYDESSTADGQDEALVNYATNEVIGVYGNTIIGNAGGKRVIYSSDLGATWSQAGDYPASILDPPDTNQWLVASNWQFTGGLWWCHMLDNQATNSVAYQASTLNGSSWTVGDTWWNDGYTITSGVVDGDTLTSLGRATSNNLWWAEYDSAYGPGSPVEPDLTLDTGANNQNCGPVLQVGSGYFATIWNGSNYYVQYFDGSFIYSPQLDAITTYDAANWGGITDFSNVATNYVDTVLISKTNLSCLKWQVSSPTTGNLDSASLSGGDFTTGTTKVAWQGNYWLAAVSNGGFYFDLYHSDDNGDSFTFGARLVLPETKTTAGSLFKVFNIYPAGKNWVANYIGADGYLKIIKWPYGTQSGTCVVGGAPP